MLHRHRQSIYALTDRLHALQANPKNMPLLLDLQKALLTKIKRTDVRIATLKAKRKEFVRLKKSRLSKEQSKTTKEAIEATDEAISDAQQLLFFWRCFGDGIAFIYIDKHALKHMLYNTHDYHMKPAAGAMRGKIGLRKEWSILKLLIGKEMPVVLSDLTNTIRHGDICGLIGPDPLPIEVKTSKNRNERVNRQLANLDALATFLQTDKAANFRGLDRVIRQEFSAPNRNHAAAMNDCIERSRRTGFAAISPEEGLTYICRRAPPDVSLFAPLMKPTTIMNELNQRKADAAWMPYFPFVLSIRRGEDVNDFMKGHIRLTVLLDTQVVVDAYEARGFSAMFVDHHQHALVVTRRNAVYGRDPIGGISIGYLARLFYDFDSIEQYIDVGQSLVERLEADTAETVRGANGSQRNLTLVAWPELAPLVTPMMWFPHS
jgi:hypothetical protein